MKIEVRSLGVISMFKTTLYMMSIPMALMFIFGFFALLAGIALGIPELVVAVIPFLIMPIFMLVVYGLFSMLMSLVYNLFASKFGGMELTIVSKDPSIAWVQKPQQADQAVDR